MIYTPPASNAVNFAIKTYTAPAASAVNFDLLTVLTADVDQTQEIQVQDVEAEQTAPAITADVDQSQELQTQSITATYTSEYVSLPPARVSGSAIYNIKVPDDFLEKKKKKPEKKEEKKKVEKKPKIVITGEVKEVQSRQYQWIGGKYGLNGYVYSVQGLTRCDAVATIVTNEDEIMEILSLLDVA